MTERTTIPPLPTRLLTFTATVRVAVDQIDDEAARVAAANDLRVLLEQHGYDPTITIIGTGANPATPMPLAEALPILIDMAARYGENAEEMFIRRPTADMTDEQCAALAAETDDEVSDVIEIRDLWRAVDAANAALAASPAAEVKQR